MIDTDIKLPCGARLTVQQGSDEQNILVGITSDIPLNQFMRIYDNKIFFAVQPENVPPILEIFDKRTRSEKFFSILKFIVFGQ